MITWFTGQPGHGKTLHAIDRALEFRDQGRLVYVCNVRDFDHAKAGCLPMTPEQFRDWPNFLPNGAVALVDEAYEHDMLPKRPPGSKRPPHVEQLAKHRHSGLDFIFVAQSPAKQIDEFVHDLIEQHVHVRRRFGLMFAHLRIFDRYERNPEKSHPIVLKRVKLPKRPMGLYKSTELDTSERRVPWYYPAAFALLAAVVIGGVVMARNVKNTFTEGTQPAAPKDGAPATAEGAIPRAGTEPTLDLASYVERQVPRMPSVPWSAPLWDGREAQSDPEVFCMASAAGDDGQGDYRAGTSCRCLTEQGTTYNLGVTECEAIARRGGSYNPFKAPQRDEPRARGAGATPAEKDAPAAAVAPVGVGHADQLQAPYGQFRSEPTGAP